MPARGEGGGGEGRRVGETGEEEDLAPLLLEGLVYQAQVPPGHPETWCGTCTLISCVRTSILQANHPC